MSDIQGDDFKNRTINLIPVIFTNHIHGHEDSELMEMCKIKVPVVPSQIISR